MKIGSKTLIKIVENTICKTIVIHGQNVGSIIGLRLSQIALNSITLTVIQQEVIIGILIGDGYIETVGIKGQPMVQFNQGFIHLSYVLFLFNFLAPLCTHYPSLIRQRDGLYSLQIYTRCLLCLSPIYNTFMVNGHKIIPQNIEELLSPRALAFWSMDDGSLAGSGFYLNTQSYSYDEHIMLQNALLNKFNLQTSIHKHGDKYKLYIRAKSMDNFRSIVRPYFVDSFLYKLNSKPKGK